MDGLFLQLKKTNTVLLVALFWAFLWGPWIAFWLPGDWFSLLRENRNPEQAPSPALLLSQPREFFRGVERFYEDRLGGRALLLRFHLWLARSLFPEWLSNRVVVGKSGWLYYAGRGSLEDIQGRIRLDSKELEGMLGALERFQAILARQGIKMYLVVPPDKHSVYPEFLPDWVGQPRGKSRLDQVLSVAKNFPSLKIMDLRKPLLEKKSLGLLYFPADSHWTPLGAWVGYEAVMAVLRRDFPGLPLLSFDQFYEKSELPGGLGRDLTVLLGAAQDFPFCPAPYLYPKRPLAACWEVSRFDNAKKLQCVARWAAKEPRFFEQENLASLDAPKVVSATGDPEKPAVLMWRDSFAVALIPFLGESFRRGVYLHLNKGIELGEVFQEKPDLVILETVEGNLLWTLQELKRALEKPGSAYGHPLAE